MRKPVLVRLSPEEKELCMRAAKFDENDLAVWMRRACIKEARKILLMAIHLEEYK